MLQKINIVILLVLRIIYVHAQNCNITSKANDMLPNGLCAPVGVNWEITYRGVNDEGTPVRISINWDDGNPAQVVNAVNTNPALGEWKATVTHTYPKNGNKCNYNPSATLMVNGVLCTSSIQVQNVTVWDTDNENGGHVAIDPVVYNVCVGNSATVTFRDVSTFNCVPPIENDNPNSPTRWTQWIYGTSYTIANTLVNGVPRVYPYSGNIVPLPGPVYGPGAPNNVSLPVSVPNTATVGQFFEVTLRNWNYCNPYDDPTIPGPPADPVNGDNPPVTTTARIVIVGLPNPTINPAGPFCANANSVNLTAATSGGTWSGPGITNPATGRFRPATAGPGTHIIQYTVTNAYGCSATDTVAITVYPVPTPGILPGATAQGCPGTDVNLNGNPSGGSGIYTTHLWTGNTTPLSATNIQAPVFNTTVTGSYNLTYRVTDSRGCSATDDIVVNINKVTANILPKPAEVCAGKNITLNGNPSGGSGNYVSHKWTGDTTPLNNTNTQTTVFNSATTGAFKLIYSVSDNYGCSGIDSITVNVYENPSAEAGPNDSICGNTYSFSAQPGIGSGHWTKKSGPGAATFSNDTSATSTVTVSQYGKYEFTWSRSFGPSCIDTSNITINFTRQPIANAGANGDTCGKTFILKAIPSIGTGTWTQLSGPGTANINSLHNATTLVTVDNYGVYSFIWTEDNGYGCTDQDTVEIEFNAIPIASFINTSSNGCPPLLINFTNTSQYATQFNWNFGNGETSILENPSITYYNDQKTDTTYYIKLIVKTDFGCSDTINNSITLHPLPTSIFSSNAVPRCSPSTVNFTNQSLNAVKYYWNFSDGSPIDSTINPTHTFINDTIFIQFYPVKLIAVSNNGCPDTSTHFVTVYPNPNYKINVNPDSFCSPYNVRILTSPGSISYNWDFGDGISKIGSFDERHIYINNSTTDTIYNIQLITTSFFGCIDTSYQQVVVHPSPTANFSIDNTIGCTPFTVQIINTSLGGNNYRWNYGNGFNDTTSADTFNYTFINPLNTPVSYKLNHIVSNKYGCSDSIQRTITVYPPVNASFSCDTSGCHYFNVAFVNQSSGAATYSWNFGDGESSNNKSPIHIFNNPKFDSDTSYLVTLIASSNYLCNDTTNALIKVYPKPIANFITNNTTGCTPLLVSITNNSLGGNNAIWNFGDGTIDTINTNVPITHTYNNKTSIQNSFDLKLTLSNNYGCSHETQLTITVNPSVTAWFICDTAGCSPLSNQFINRSTGTNEYTWNFGDGTNSYISNPTHLLKNNSINDTVYEVSLIAKSVYGCSDTAIRHITVYPSPVAKFSAQPTLQIYPSTTVNITNQTNEGNWNYLWNFGDGAVSIQKEPLPHNYENWGNYIIRLMVWNNHCSDSTSNNIQIIAAKPIASFDSSTTGCEPLTVYFKNHTLYATSYLWNFGDGTTSRNENPIHTYYKAGTYIVSLTATGPGGTDEADEKIITVYKKPQVYFTIDPIVVYLPEQPAHFLNKTENAQTYLWEFGDGETSTQKNTVHLYKEPGIYNIKLSAWSEHLCFDSLILERAITAELSGKIKFPNAFTPNPHSEGDGKYTPGDYRNDIFYPLAEGVSEIHLQIFNRWGELIFESFDINTGWNGYYKHQLCKQDVYVWKAKGKFANGQSFSKAGDVTLLR